MKVNHYQKINLQPVDNIPQIARNTLVGSANFCLRTITPIAELVKQLKKNKVVILDGPAMKEGANGPLLSVYFNDLDGNLVEVSNEIESE